MNVSTVAESYPFSSYSEQNKKGKNCTKPLISEISKDTSLKRRTDLERAEKIVLIDINGIRISRFMASYQP